MPRQRMSASQKKKKEVEISGFEPEASRMQSERSTTELYPLPDGYEQLFLFIGCLHHRDGCASRD